MTRTLDLQADVHRRLNPLTREWVLVSPSRTMRPWQGQVEAPSQGQGLKYDPQCYLCPGNTRAGGAINPSYSTTFVFDNDFPALGLDAPLGELGGNGLLTARSETGCCRVICYSPLHNVSLGLMPLTAIRRLIDTWEAQYRALGAHLKINAVSIFENRGAAMGASNAHPHGQIWANESPPNEVVKETASQLHYLRERGSCLLCDYAELETKQRERLVCCNEHFIAVVPFWATWPFETLVLPRAHATALDELNPARRDAFAEVLKELTTRYDALFNIAFPYTMGLHQRPTDGSDHPPWHLHAHFYPPLLRSASVRKFMVGYEMLAGPQRDITPEAAAALLRKVVVSPCLSEIARGG